MTRTKSRSSGWQRYSAAAPTLDVDIVEDHAVMLEGLAVWLEGNTSGIRVVGRFASWAELVPHLGRLSDVVILDVLLGDNIPLSAKIRALLSARAASDGLQLRDRPGSDPPGLRGRSVGVRAKDLPGSGGRSRASHCGPGTGIRSPRSGGHCSRRLHHTAVDGTRTSSRFDLSRRRGSHHGRDGAFDGDQR